ncbi:MAG TPA: bifunctional 5,10-methylenetetrahydrofolate dehydrogenase/5,10-methenyltetrahydrofolate cyclohydrolase [Candidatus Limnocylindrales bacterium]
MSVEDGTAASVAGATSVAGPASVAGATATGPRLLAGGSIAVEMRAGLAVDFAAFKERWGHTPTLAVVLVGADAPSAVYLQQILRTCEKVGAHGRLVELGSDVTPDALCNEIENLNADPSVAGIIVQMPLPAHIPLHTVIDSIDPAKDIDGIHPRNAGLLSLGYDGFLPATAQASVEILKRSGVEIAGKRVVVIGRSNVVGKPAALLLMREHGTVTVLHSRTRDLAHHTRDAEILIVAAGKPGLVTGQMLSPGVVVVDVGINVVPDGSGAVRLVGDVDFESAKDVVSAITPVPGGVGPLTNALLLTHLLRAATDQAKRAAWEQTR